MRACLEAALQLLSRVGSLGPIEAFFVADELLAHYQNRVGVTHSLLDRSVRLRLAACLRSARCHGFATTALCLLGDLQMQLLTVLWLSVLRRLGGETPHCTARQDPKQAAAVQQQAGACSCSKCKLKLTDQQQHIVSSFHAQVRQLLKQHVQVKQQCMWPYPDSSTSFLAYAGCQALPDARAVMSFRAAAAAV